MSEEVNVKKLAEFVWGKGKVKLLWGYTDHEGCFESVPPGQKRDRHDNEQVLCFLGPDSYWEVVPDFPNDLNACEEHLFPNIKDIVGFYIYPTTDGWNVTMVTGTGPHPLYWNDYEGHGRNLATSFCKAVEQLVDEKRGNKAKVTTEDA